MRYYLGVVSKEHVLRGVEEGIAQVCHGKKRPLLKCQAGDGFVYYSPKIALNQKEPCKCFTAIGKVKTGQVYQVEISPQFRPYRIDIDYYSAQDLPIAKVMDQLELTQNKNWGFFLRRGFLEISQADFYTIAAGMHAQDVH